MVILKQAIIKAMILFIIIGNVHQFIVLCLISYDTIPWEPSVHTQAPSPPIQYPGYPPLPCLSRASQRSISFYKIQFTFYYTRWLSICMYKLLDRLTYEIFWKAWYLYWLINLKYKATFDPRRNSAMEKKHKLHWK